MQFLWQLNKINKQYGGIQENQNPNFIRHASSKPQPKAPSPHAKPSTQPEPPRRHCISRPPATTTATVALRSFIAPIYATGIHLLLFVFIYGLRCVHLRIPFSFSIKRQFNSFKGSKIF